MSKFRVAIFTGNYNHIRDGVSLTLNRLVDFLMQNDVGVVVFGPTTENPEVDHAGEFVPVPSKPAPGRPEYRISTGLSAEAKSRLEEFDPDIVHIATPDILGYRALKWAKKNKKIIVASYHTHFPSYLKYYGFQWLEPAGWKYLQWFYNHCSQIYVPTPSMAKELKENKISNGLIIWARGVDTNLFNPERRSEEWRSKYDILPDDVVVTFVSRLVWEKNLKMFADVLLTLQKDHENLKAVVVGNGPAGDEFKTLLPSAIMTGFLKGEELARSYASSDIFFFPSDTETFGSVTLEAMASGLPCVVADAAGSKSLVENAVNGYRADAEDYETFLNRTDELIKNRDLRKEMGDKSFDKAKEYSWENINGKLLSCYKDILSSKKKL